MGLESGTWIEDLVVTNPPSTDDKRQGDDHIRLIKSVLKNSLKRTSGRPVYFPTSASLTSDYTILDTDENTIFRCSTTTGPINLTLPNTLTAANSGWRVYVVKINVDPTPVFIIPPTGLLDGYTKVRRTAENKRTEVMWTGTGWTITRPESAPVGTVHEFYGVTLPNGYLWPDGTSFNAADFVELNAAFGGNTKPDLRGRAAFGRDDMGGVAAGRVTTANSGIIGTTLKATGGAEVVTLTTSQLAVHSHAVSGTHSHGPGSLGTDTHTGHQHDAFIRDPGHTHVNNAGTGANAGQTAAPIAGSQQLSNTGTSNTGVRVNSVSGGNNTTDNTVALGGAHSHAVTSGATAAISPGPTDNSGSGQSHQNMPPTLVCNKIIVAE